MNTRLVRAVPNTWVGTSRNALVALVVLVAVAGCKSQGGGATITMQDCPDAVGCLKLPEKPQRAGASPDTVLLTNVITAESDKAISLLRLRADGATSWSLEEVTVRDPRPEISGEVTFEGVTWAGDHWIGLLAGGYVDNQWGTTYLATLATVDLQITETKKSTRRLGAITWDGTGYWAIDGDDGSTLLRLDARFAPIESYPLDRSCSDLAWDGSQPLCLTSDTVFRVDVRADRARLVKIVSLSSPADGLAWQKGSLWLMHMDQRELHERDM